MAGRVWDPYLTEQDRAHLAASGHRPCRFGERPALVLVDLYRAVFGDRPEPLLEAIKTWPQSCGLAAWNAIPHIQRLLSASRRAGIPIVHITMLSGTGVPGWSVVRGTEPAPLPPGLQRRTDLGEIIPEVAPLPGETVIRKASPSAFWGSPLSAHLNWLEVDTLIVCGESTSGCVRATVVDGRSHRFHMVVVEEGVFDRHQAAHAMSLFDMDQKYADVLPLGEVERYLAGLRDGRVPAEGAGEPALAGSR